MGLGSMGGHPTETRDWRSAEGRRSRCRLACGSRVAVDLGWFVLVERISGEEDLTRRETGPGKEPLAHKLPPVAGEMGLNQ